MYQVKKIDDEGRTVLVVHGANLEGTVRMAAAMDDDPRTQRFIESVPINYEIGDDECFVSTPEPADDSAPVHDGEQTLFESAGFPEDDPKNGE